MENALNLINEANKRFIGQLGVVGVGETARESSTMVFLLSEWSPSAWLPILEWANRKGIQVGYEVVGSVNAR